MPGKPEVFQKIDGLHGETIVLLNWDGQAPKFCNFQKQASDGTVIWTASPHHPLEGIWTEVTFQNGQLEAFNMAGFLDLIDYETGRILSRKFTK